VAWAEIAAYLIFNTFSYYFLFLVPAAALFRVAPQRLRPWIIVLFGGGFFLYFAYGMAGWWGAACLLIFLWESVISRLYRPSSRWCMLGIIQSVVLLGIFKYWNFFTGLIFHHGVNPLRWQGPIKRYQDFLPKLRAEPMGWDGDWERGITRILVGLVKKFAVADLLTAWTDHLNAHDILVADRRILPFWALAYGIKIYTDFSGYSDIAIGSARLFGIRVPENFDWPYGRRNIQRFWQCWHISLTRWLMDYVYIPLGGSRVSKPRIYANIIAVMLVSGLWHGAGLNFVVWGLWHGLLLAGHRFWRQLRPVASNQPQVVLLSRVLTFVLVNAGWPFFCMDLHTAILFYRRLLAG